MDKIYIFDIDGTLTPSRLRMTEEFAKFFDNCLLYTSPSPRDQA